MKTKHLVFSGAIASLVIAAPAQAADPAAGQAGIQVKNKSHFNAAPDMHNPFWPIGWVKQGPVPVATAVRPTTTLNPANYSISSILLGNPAIAVINGREYEEGQYLLQDGRKTDVQVASIRDGEVILRSADAQISIQMKRK